MTKIVVVELFIRMHNLLCLIFSASKNRFEQKNEKSFPDPFIVVIMKII